MPRITRSSRMAHAGLAVVTALSLAACSSDDGGSTETTSGDGPSSQAAPASDERPATPVGELLLTAEETPGGGVVTTIKPDQAKPEVDKLVESQGRELMTEPACDRIARLETVANHAATDGASAVISYQQSQEDDTRHHFGVGLVPARLEDFLDRSLYEACTTSAVNEHPEHTLNVSVADAPEVAGAQGFRVVSDVLVNAPDGTTQLRRDISIHGYARGITTSIEYRAIGTDAAQNPVLPTADGALNAIYTAQMNKILQAE